MFEGEMEEGELEIGQVSGLIREIKPAAEIVKELMEDCEDTIKKISNQYT
jgi:enoyl-[acyl-carrier protein] reductase II